MSDGLTNLRLALRRLRQAPLFTALTVFTLAVALGANVAAFSLIHGVLLQPLPYSEPDQLIGVWHTAPGLGIDDLNQGAATYFTYRELSESFEDIGLWDTARYTVTGLGEPEQVRTLQVSDGLLPVLRVDSALGRRFSAEDDLPDQPTTVMLSDGYWRSRFAAAPDVIGKTLTVNGEICEIIGVLGPDFQFLDYSLDILLPFQFDPAAVVMGDFSYQSIGRLKPGATLEQAQAEIESLIPVAVEKYPGPISTEMVKDAQLAAALRPLRQDAIGDIGATLWLLLGTVGLVLFIACANIANLFLVRSDGRQLEVAVRTALGASPSAVTRTFLGESLLLAFSGGALGLALAAGALELLQRFAPGRIPRLDEVALNPVVALYVLGLTLLVGLALGALAAWRRRGGSLLGALKDGGRGGDGRERQRARGLLVTAQVAVALVLLVSSGLMLRSFEALRQVQPGFSDPESALSLRVAIPSAEIADEAEVALAFESMLTRLEAIPGVNAVGLTTSVPLDGNDSNDAVMVEAFPTPEGQVPPVRRMKWLAPGTFQTLGNPLLAGRDFSWDDLRQRRRVAVVTADFVSDYWPTPADALGQRILPGIETGWVEIVGVVGAVHDDGVDRPSIPMVYQPMIGRDADGEDDARRSMAFVLRSPRTGTPELLQEARAAIWAVNPNLPVASVRSMEELLQRSLSRTTFILSMLGLAALVALILGAVGIYGVTSYAVSQRTRELGLRLALGARQIDLGTLVLRQALTFGVAGIVVGVVAALGLTRLMETLLFGVEAIDLGTYALVAVALLALTLLAAYLPARRAAKVDPLEALRWE
ncbi:MAG: ABC transporter permease [Acidobacteriota bacterium]